MKINQPPELPLAQAVASASRSAAQATNATASSNARTAATHGARSSGVAVTVSTLARTLEAANQGGTSDVDMSKVQGVRQAIEDGSYVVDAPAIADKLLANAQEMLERARR